MTTPPYVNIMTEPGTILSHAELHSLHNPIFAESLDRLSQNFAYLCSIESMDSTQGPRLQHGDGYRYKLHAPEEPQVPGGGMPRQGEAKELVDRLTC